MNAGDEQPPPRVEPIAPGPDLAELLQACDLPIDDIYEEKPLIFFGCREAGRLIAVVGVEKGSRTALLRSLAVAPEARGRGLARRLVAFVEHLNAARDVQALYLLTTTAADFFRRLGYVDTARERAPDSIRAGAQFSRLCPDDADFLMKPLARN